MAKTLAETGTTAVAIAMRQINPDVVAAYPITPQTAIVQEFSQFVADGLVDTEFVTVESEHSAMSACVGAAAAGARVMTATSANGLALMWEVLYIASGLRLPIVMTNVNRALSGPINIHCDHSDSMGARDSGWVQIFSETSQEAYDNVIQAVRIAEYQEVRLPVMVMMDGFIISHGIEMFDILEDEEVKSFVGEPRVIYPLLDVDHPVTHGAFDLPDFYFEHKRQQVEGMRNSKKVILEVGEEYARLCGREQPLYKSYFLEDAEIAIVVLGSTAGTARDVVDELRGKGVRAGILSPRIFRPFPALEYAEALRHLKAVALLERSDSFGAQGGPLFSEFRSALYDYEERPKTLDIIYGLGGRDIRTEDIKRVFQDLIDLVEKQKAKEMVSYLGVRE